MKIKLINVYWRDIPSQLIAQRGRVRQKVLLSARFQEAVDRAAMRAGKGSSAAYLSEWRREPEAIETATDMMVLLEARASELENRFTDAQLEGMVRAHGEALT